jgi:hypothetical protein
MPVEGSAHADAAWGGVRLTLPLRAGAVTAEVSLEPAHCERLFRAAAYAAVRDGRLDPAGGNGPLVARLVPGVVRARHGEVACLESCAVELLDGRGAVVGNADFPRAVFAAFAMARAVHLVEEGARDVASLGVAYSLHAAASAEEEPFPVALPALPPLSVDALRARAEPRGVPDDGWIATFVAPEVEAGFADMDRESRASGVEVAGRIHARVGWDPARRTFVRLLDRLVVSHATRATAVTVVSTAASWGEFLGTDPGAGVQAPSSVHTHLHLPDVRGGEGARGDDLLAADEPSQARVTVISIHDIVTHYTAFPDPLSAGFIVSLFPDGRVVSLYGYTPRGQLRAEPGWWVLLKEDLSDAEADHGA